MSSLSPEHIDYIIKDLHYRGIVAEGIEDELIDHVCSAVEIEMARGASFMGGYLKVLHAFGHNTGLRKVQSQIIQSKNHTTYIMLQNYITIALRNLKKHRFYSFINIIGLASGVAACMIIALFVFHELSYDRFNANADHIFRVNTHIKFGGNDIRLATASPPLAEIISQNYSEVVATVRFLKMGSHLVRKSEGAEVFRESKIIWADSSFFTVFSIPVIYGHSGSALRDPNTIAISKKMAEKYFPEGNALEQSLVLDKDSNHKITAIFEDIPANSHFHFDFIVSMAEMEDAKSVSMVGGGDFNTYLLLKDKPSAMGLEAKFPKLIDKFIAPQMANVLGADFTMEKFRAAGNLWEFSLTPLTDIHLNSSLTGELEPNGNITYIYLFSTIGLFILIIACINFMNLSTARSANRAKEVGIRKVLGSLRFHLVRQFLTESLLLSLFSILLAILLAYLFLPTFNDLSQRELSLPLKNFSFYAVLLSAAVVVGILAGLYPSFFLSAFKPINVLKGRVSLGLKSGFIRSSLVVFQFVISIFLIIGTITINRQLNYIQNKKLGFEKDQVIVVNEADDLKKNIQAYKEEVIKNSFIKSGTISGYLPVAGTWRSYDTFWGDGPPPSEGNMEEFVNLQKWRVDHDYIKTMGMKIKLGRDFNPGSPADSSAVILNEAAVQRFHLEGDPLGKKISHFDGANVDGTPNAKKIRSWTVIGVVEDFHFESLRQTINPLAFILEESRGNVSFRFEAGNTQEVIQTLERKWKELAPGQPFKYSFLNDDFGRMYASEQRLGKIFGLFAGLAILVACLGLFALSAFTAEQRTKEIGIRKVLGASVNNIVIMLSGEFGKLILIAFVVTIPLSWFAIDWWLKSYTYKVEIGLMVYLLAGVIAFLVAWTTMSYQSIKAATANPVNSLRNE